MEFEQRENKDLIAEYDSMVMLFEDDIDKLNATLGEKDSQVVSLSAQLDRYKQKLTQLTHTNQRMKMEKSVFEDEESRE